MTCGTWERRETAREQHTHTVLSVLMTKAGLSKLEAYRLAHNMQVRLSRVFYPYSFSFIRAAAHRVCPVLPMFPSRVYKVRAHHS